MFCCDLYYCSKKFIYIYKIVLEVGRGGSPQSPKGRGWGKVVCPAPRGGAGTGKGNNHAGRGRRSHPPAPPRPIAIPSCMCINPITSYFLVNADFPAPGYHKKSHEYYACKKILRPSHDYWLIKIKRKRRRAERDYCIYA